MEKSAAFSVVVLSAETDYVQAPAAGVAQRPLDARRMQLLE
jgi:hypothetical protein